MSITYTAELKFTKIKKCIQRFSPKINRKNIILLKLHSTYSSIEVFIKKINIYFRHNELILRKI